MKKFLLFIASLTMLTAKAQTSVYHPFPEDSATWCETACAIQVPILAIYADATYQLDGKTLINGNWYSRMLHYDRGCQGSFSGCWCVQLNGTDTTTYYIRQDVLQKKVWIYLPATNSDTIFLNFNLNVGDTIDGRNEFWAQQWGNDFAIVSSIDSVLIGSQYRTRYNYTYQSFLNSMIEGIGPEHGLFYVANKGFDYADALTNFTQNNQIFYPNYSPDTTGMGQFCYRFPTGIEELNHISLSISPNPSFGKFIFSFGKTIIKGTVEILNVLGENIFVENISNQSNEEINLMNISNGIYFVKVLDGENSYCKKIIVDHD